MKPDKAKIAAHIAHYGSAIEAWPEDLQVWGAHALRDPGCAALFHQEKAFEQLLDAYSPEPMPPDVVERAIAASYSRPQEAQWHVLPFLMQTINPAALAAMLALGFMLGGAVAPALMDDTPPSVYADDEGAGL